LFNASNKRVFIYLLFTFALSWGVWIVLYFAGASSTIILSLSSAVMWFPAGAVFLARALTGKDRILAYSLKPKFKGNVKIYLNAWWFPVFVAILGGALYFCIFQDSFDGTFSSLNLMLSQNNINIEDLPISPTLLAVVQIIASMIYGPFINTFFALGEEIGWRGFLFPALSRRFSNTKAHLLTGLIWGVWHTPINMLGHNYGLEYPGYPWLGIVAMCLFTFSIGVYFSWLSEKSGSIWPAALAHGAVNAAAGIPFLFQAPDIGIGAPSQIFGPGLSALVAGVPILLIAVVILIRNKGAAVAATAAAAVAAETSAEAASEDAAISEIAET